MLTLRQFLKEIAQDVEEVNLEAKRAQEMWLRDNAEKQDGDVLELDTIKVRWPDGSEEQVVSYGLAEPNSFGIQNLKVKVKAGFILKNGIINIWTMWVYSSVGKKWNSRQNLRVSMAVSCHTSSLTMPTEFFNRD